MSPILVAGCGFVLACANASWKSLPNHQESSESETNVPTEGAVHRATVSVDEVEREFSYFVPGGAVKQKRPIVIYLHGHGDNMRHILGNGLVPSASSKWMDVAEREDFLVIYPLGLKAPGRRAKTGWNDCRTDVKGNPTEDDVAFIKQLIEFAANELEGDRQRVYVTGMSNGGHMTMRVAMEMSDRVAAVAPIAALLPKNRSCSPPSQPVPVLMMHGTEDPLAPFEGGSMAGDRGVVLSAKEMREQWVEWNELGDVQEDSFLLPDTDPSDESTIFARVRELAPGGNAVVAYEMRGAGHTEPSPTAKLGRLLQRVVGNQNHDIEMAEAVWEFFKTRSR